MYQSKKSRKRAETRAANKQKFQEFAARNKKALNGIAETTRQIVDNTEVYQEANRLSQRNAISMRNLDHIIAQKLIENVKEAVSKVNGGEYEPTAGEVQTIRYLLAADDFSLSRLIAKGVKLLTPHVGRVLSAIGSEYGIPDTLLSYVKQLTRQDVRAGVPSLNQVNKEALAMLVNPLRYQALLPFSGAQNSKMAIGYGSLSIPVTSSAQGQCVVNLYPRALGSSGMAYILNDATLNTTTGAQNIAGTAVVGPYFGSAAIDTGFACSVAVSWLPQLAESNANGRIYMAYYQQEPIANSRTQAFVDLATSMLAPYHQEFGVNQTARLVVPLDQIPILSSSTGITNTMSHVAQLIVTGVPASQLVGSIKVDYVIQFIPLANYQNLIQLSYPKAGPATLECFTQMQYRLPELTFASQERADKIAACILESEDTFEGVLSCLNH